MYLKQEGINILNGQYTSDVGTPTARTLTLNENQHRTGLYIHFYCDAGGVVFVTFNISVENIGENQKDKFLWIVGGNYAKRGTNEGYVYEYKESGEDTFKGRVGISLTYDAAGYEIYANIIEHLK